MFVAAGMEAGVEILMRERLGRSKPNLRKPTSQSAGTGTGANMGMDAGVGVGTEMEMRTIVW